MTSVVVSLATSVAVSVGVAVNSLASESGVSFSVCVTAAEIAIASPLES